MASVMFRRCKRVAGPPLRVKVGTVRSAVKGIRAVALEQPLELSFGEEGTARINQWCEATIELLTQAA
jgi:hypothetical protein